MTDERHLLRKLQKRQRFALEQAIELYTPYVSTVLFNIAGTQLTREDTEEIMSDVFINLWKSADYIDLEKGTIRSYLAATAKNCALKKLQKFTDSIPIDEINLSVSDNVSEIAEKDALSEHLWRAVADLGEPDNEIFVRYYKYGEKLRDISKATDIKLSTVKTKLSRGREKLKKIISDKEEWL